MDTRESLLAAAHALAPRIRACADEAERARRLPLPLVRTMAEAGFFRMLLPRALGGGEADPLTYYDVVEALSAADGAAGWCVLISTTSMWYAASRLPQAVAAAIFADDPYLIVAGSAPPNGRALPVAGGYLVTGRWTMGSGIEHAGWVMAGCRIVGDEPAAGRPETRLMVFPASACTVIDTWQTSGLRGTGSHDFAVTDLFVPAERTLAGATPASHAGPLYAFANITNLAHAAHALGIARTALDAFLELAGGKTPTWSPSKGLLRERAPAQTRVAEAEALIGSARAYVRENARDVWTTLCAGNTVTEQQRATFRLAVAHAMTSALDAVNLLHRAAGATAVYSASPLDRCFRDLHAAAAHVWVAEETYEIAGRMLLGLDPGTILI